MVKTVLTQVALQKGACVDPWGGVSLEIDLVAASVLSSPSKKVVKTHFIEERCGGVGGEVSPEPFKAGVGPVDHDHGVPPNDPAEPDLELFIPRVGGFLGDRDGVHIIGDKGTIRDGLEFSSLFEEGGEQEAATFPSLLMDHLFEGLDPFLGLSGVCVSDLLHIHSFSSGLGVNPCAL
jgi:hypothetical protein